MRLHELKHYIRQWTRATHRNRAQNIYYHYDKHGDKLSLPAYLAAAERFPRNQARKMIPRQDGTTRFEDRQGRFLIVRTDNGLIVSYGEN